MRVTNFTPVVFLLISMSFTISCVAQERVRDRIADRREKNADTSERITAPGQYSFRIKHDGQLRGYILNVPRSYTAGKPHPVVIGLHGGGGHAAQFANDENYGVISASEKYGFIAVIPNGYSKLRNGRFATWNAGACCGWARDNGSKDVEYIATVISRVKTQLPIDGQRVYAIGMSNGALMTYRLACEMSETLAGIMAVAGTDNTTKCADGKPVPVLHVHALNDTHVLFNGGAGDDAIRDRTKITEFNSVPATIEKWVARNHAETSSIRVKQVDGAWCDLHEAKTGGAPVKLCVTETGGHSWPGASATPRGKALPSQVINANDEMWSFFLEQ